VKAALSPLELDVDRWTLFFFLLICRLRVLLFGSLTHIIASRLAGEETAEKLRHKQTKTESGKTIS